MQFRPEDPNGKTWHKNRKIWHKISFKINVNLPSSLWTIRQK